MGKSDHIENPERENARENSKDEEIQTNCKERVISAKQHNRMETSRHITLLFSPLQINDQHLQSTNEPSLVWLGDGVTKKIGGSAVYT